MRNEKDALKHPTHTLFCLPKPYSTRTFLFLVKGCLFPLIEDSIYKRRSTEETQIALTDTIYEKVRQWNFLSSRLALKPFFSEKGKSSYLCNYGLCRPLFRSSTLLSLSNSVLPDKTDFLPTREGLWETEPGTKNESISVHGSCWPAAAQLFERNAVWFRFDKGRMPGRRSKVGGRRVRFGSRARTRNRRCTILAAMYVDLYLRNSSNWTHTQRRTTSSGLDERKNFSIKFN